jgi:hypothetical protein
MRYDWDKRKKKKRKKERARMRRIQMTEYSRRSKNFFDAGTYCKLGDL